MSDPNRKTTWDSQSAPRLLPQLIRRRWLIVLSTLAGLLIACGALMSVRPRYEVSGTLMLQLGREMTAPPTVSESRVMPAVKRSEDLATEIEIMSGQQIVKDLVDHFGEDFFYHEPPARTLPQKAKRLISKSLDQARELVDDAISGLGLRKKLSRLEKVTLALQSSIVIEPARKSDVTRISLQISDPDAGVQILRKFIDLYLAKHVDVYRASKAKPFLDSETSTLLAQIQKLQDERIEFKKNNDIYSGEIQRKLLLDQAEMGRAAKSELVGEMERIKAELDASVARLDSMPRELQTSNIKQRNPLLSIFETKIAALQAEREEARLRYNEGSRSLLDLDAQIAAFQPKLEEAAPLVMQSVTTGANAARLDLDREIDAKRIQMEGMKARMAEVDRNQAIVEKRLREMETSETRLRDIERELELKEISYTMYRKFTEQARINDAMDAAQIANVVIIDPPTASLRPVWPSFKLWLAAGGLAGLCASLGLVFLSDVLRPRVRVASDVKQAAGVEVIGSIPEIKRFPRRPVGEIFASAEEHYLRLSNDLQSLPEKPRSILVAASRAGEGATQVAVGLAIALARNCADNKVLLIDADFRSASGLSRRFNLNGSAGVSGWSAPGDLPIQSTSVPNLSVLAAGPTPDPKDRDARLQKLRTVSEIVSSQFNFIVWDAPGIMDSYDAKKLAGLTEGVLLVVEANQTLLGDLQQVRDQFARAGIKPLGAVLSRADRYAPRFTRSKNAD